ncbi:unnamed protein product [Heterobilharzia americana]|nr:unnamed protein product [Heterobilharzia americana]
MESDEILKKLKASAEDISKEQFLQEANEALQQAAANTDEKETDSAELDLNFLQKRKTEEKSSNKKAKNECSYDLEKIVFTDSSNKEAEEFLRDYIINKRWREGNARGRNSIPAYSDVLRKAGFDVDDKTKNFPKDDDILDEDDEFLVKVNDSEKERLQSLGVHVGISQMQKVQHRFEEEDKEFIKSYPRYIENSIGQTLSKTSKRAEKRKAKMERKRKEKQAKFQELARLRNLKLGMLAEKIERIKRSCGPGSLPLDINKLFTSQTEDESKQCPQHTETSNNVDALDVAEYLDEDWDPDKHEQLLSSMFGKEYEEVDEDISKPEFSDDSDLEVEHVTNIKEKSASKKKCEQDASYGLNNDFQEELTETQSNDNDVCNRIPTMNVNTKSSRSKRKLHEALERKKPVFDPDDYPDYEKYFEEFYQLHCEDIIPGSSADEDIYCRFKYRNVTPNDFGLSTEEILKADTKELNAWISLKRIVSYLSNDEEMRDKELYSSHYQIKRKKQILNSLNSPEATWWPKEKKMEMMKVHHPRRNADVAGRKRNSTDRKLKKLNRANVRPN